MNCDTAVKKAYEKYFSGDVESAITTLRRFLNRQAEPTWVSENARAYLNIGVFLRIQGHHEEPLRIYSTLVKASESDVHVRANALVEMAVIHTRAGQPDQAEACFASVCALIDCNQEPGIDPVHDKVMVHFLNNKGLLRLTQERANEALMNLRKSLDHIIAVHATEDFSKPFVTAYLNLYYCHMILGNHDQAIEYLLLARAKLMNLDTPFAYELVNIFETLAVHNLFVAGSQQNAIDALSYISEKVVSNFADFRKVFDFFCSIIVQLHDGKIDLEKIRESIREYGNDPLIKAYLPVLLAGAPPPGSDDGDDDIPTATLTD